MCFRCDCIGVVCWAGESRHHLRMCVSWSGKRKEKRKSTIRDENSISSWLSECLHFSRTQQFKFNTLSRDFSLSLSHFLSQMPTERASWFRADCGAIFMWMKNMKKKSFCCLVYYIHSHRVHVLCCVCLFNEVK